MNWLEKFRGALANPPTAAIAVSQPGPERISQLRRLEEALGYRFKNYALLDQALTHRSYLHDAGNRSDSGDYEALEFFGDTVVGLVVSEALFRDYPTLREGGLSKLKAHLVSARQLSRLSLEIGLADYLLLSHGEEKTGGRKKRAILADIFESVTAAIYLDGGLEAARRFLLRRFAPLLEEIDPARVKVRDFKSALQESLHSLGRNEPNYRVVRESGPDHRKEFVVEVVSAGKSLARGQGRSKKEAEQEAARAALELFSQQMAAARRPG
ncbi:MAG TPA: ribonuclease III [Acidobacteriota bacterium]|nr:ribonuclease III [Acidobacteriota bacterium]